METTKNEVSYPLLFTVIVLIILGAMYYNAKKKHEHEHNEHLSIGQWINKSVDPKLVKLAIGTILVLGILGAISFNLFVKERKTEYSLTNVKHWLNNTSELNPDGSVTLNQLTMVKILASMAFGVIFGFIDNAGLFFGMDALDPHVQKISTDPKVSAGIGNTYSDVIGAFAGSFAGSIVQQSLKNQLPDCFEGPLWAEATGILLGCIIGIIIPKAIAG